MFLWLVSCGAARLAAVDGGVAADGSSDVQSLLQEGRLHEAIVRLKSHLQRAPHDTAAQRKVANASFRLGDYKTCAAYTTTILSDHPDDRWARQVFSLSMLFLQDAVDPNDAPALLELGRQCVAGGAYATAAPFFRRYLNIVPEDVATHKEYARILSWNEPITRSIAEYRRLLEGNPEDDAVRMEMARLMNQAGLHDAAVRQLQVLLTRQPEYPGARVELVRALAWNGDNEGCTALLHKLAQKPAVLEPASLQFLADTAARLSRPVEERAFLLEAERVGGATSAMRARLEALTLRVTEKPGAPADVATSDADFDDFWRIIMNHRRSLYRARIRIGDAWMPQNPGDLASAWETGKIHELLQQNERALACYTQVVAVSGTPQVLAHVGRLQALIAAAASTPGKPETKP